MITSYNHCIALYSSFTVTEHQVHTLLNCNKHHFPDVHITVQPTDVHVCSGSDAIFSCIIRRPNDQEYTTVGWQILNKDGDFVSVENRDRHTITETHGNETELTEMLQISNVTASDNGTWYRCNPITGIVMSNNVSLNVAGKNNTVDL